ncbi:ATP-binding cassette domain-containing protein [Vibrio sp. RC27]
MMLEIKDLRVKFKNENDQEVEVVHGINLSLAKGETLGIVGESGSGKSVLSLATIGLLPKTAKATGEILFNDEDILSKSEQQMCRLRGSKIGMIFQEPMTALNPAMKVGAQIAEGLRLHRKMSRSDANAEVIRLLDMVKIPDAKRKMHVYPHEMSGGQRQRVGIAIALALEPDLLIADEPTTALDVTVQAEVLDILDDLVSQLGIALILISHDLGVIARIADRTLVMYQGNEMEQGETAQILRHPRSEYTRQLIDAQPRRVRENATLTQVNQGEVV